MKIFFVNFHKIFNFFLLQGIRPYKCHICGNGKAAFLYGDMPIMIIFEFNYIHEILNYLITHTFNSICGKTNPSKPHWFQACQRR